MTDPLDLVREGLAGEEGIWLVGGAVRDRLLGRPVKDLDLAVAGDVRAAAKGLARHVHGPAFELSEDFGAWRVIGPERSFEVDLSPLRGATIEEDLGHRDFTVNAMAQPLATVEPARTAVGDGVGDPDVHERSAGGASAPGLADPFGGLADLADRRLRAVSRASFSDDPLRVLRLARVACELDLVAEPETLVDAQRHAARLADVAQERVFTELRRIVGADAALDGLALTDRTGAMAAVLPELHALQGVEQTVYHHRDAYGHTLEVLEQAIALERDAPAILGDDDLGARVTELLSRPLADEMTRAEALRFAALLHDAAKPLTQTPNPKGGFGFPGHDRVGADLVETILGRLRASVDLRRHVAALTRHHLRPGFLVHHRPLDPRTVYGYLKATEPVEVDTLLLSVADRCATRGRKSGEAIEKHLGLVRELLPPALEWHDHGPPAPLVRGDELARELGITPGPDLGRLLAEIAEAQYAGEVSTRDDAVAHARASAAR